MAEPAPPKQRTAIELKADVSTPYIGVYQLNTSLVLHQGGQTVPGKKVK